MYVIFHLSTYMYLLSTRCICIDILSEQAPANIKSQLAKERTMQHNEGADFLRNITTSWRSIGQVKSLQIQLYNVMMILCSKFLSEPYFP